MSTDAASLTVPTGLTARLRARGQLSRAAAGHELGRDGTEMAGPTDCLTSSEAIRGPPVAGRLWGEVVRCPIGATLPQTTTELAENCQLFVFFFR